MRVKMFWKNQPGRPSTGLFGTKLSFKNGQDLENEINDWLDRHPSIKVVDVKQTASGGSFADSLWFISVWYEQSAS